MAGPSPDSPAATTTMPDNQSGDTKSSCERAANKWFKEKYQVADEQTPLGSGKATYTSHFSGAKNSCFMEAVQTVHLMKDGATNTVDSEIHRLIDLKTGEQLGQLVIFSDHNGPLWCEVAKVKCWSVKEWSALVAAYMKD
jgi:hypothetical protein